MMVTSIGALVAGAGAGTARAEPTLEASAFVGAVSTTSAMAGTSEAGGRVAYVVFPALGHVSGGMLQLAFEGELAVGAPAASDGRMTYGTPAGYGVGSRGHLMLRLADLPVAPFVVAGGGDARAVTAYAGGGVEMRLASGWSVRSDARRALDGATELQLGVAMSR
jgi:hypothetical protein